MSEKILIVDDEPSNRKILAQELVHKGFAVDTARGGREALAKIESAPPELVILDYMMPDMSGLEVLKDLRKFRVDQLRTRHFFLGYWLCRIGTPFAFNPKFASLRLNMQKPSLRIVRHRQRC